MAREQWAREHGAVLAAPATMQRVRPPRDWDAPLVLREGDSMDLDTLRAALASRGYHWDERVDEPAEGAMRGAAADLFPAGDACPVRIEWAEGEACIAALHRSDPLTQRSTAAVPLVVVHPATEHRLDPSEIQDAAELMAHPGATAGCVSVLALDTPAGLRCLGLLLLLIGAGLLVPKANLRLSLYRRLARLDTPAAVADFANELQDRFGPLPAPAASLLAVARLRAVLHGAGVAQADLGPDAAEQLSRLGTPRNGRVVVPLAVPDPADRVGQLTAVLLAA